MQVLAIKTDDADLGNYVTTEEFKEFQCVPQLKELHFTGIRDNRYNNYSGNENLNFKVLSVICNSFKYMPQLEVLNVSKNLSASQESMNMFDAFTNNIHHLLHLKSLQLNACFYKSHGSTSDEKYGDTLFLITSVIQCIQVNGKKLEDLHFSDCSLDDNCVRHLASMLHCFPNLEQLNLLVIRQDLEYSTYSALGKALDKLFDS